MNNLYRRYLQELIISELESDAPGRPDEHAFGITYDEIDDFLQGGPSATRRTRRL